VADEQSRAPKQGPPAGSPAGPPHAAAGRQPLSEAQLAGEIERLVLRDLEADTLELPSLPTAAVRTIKTLGDSEYRTDEVSRLVETDPLLAAQLVRLASSAAFARRSPIGSIRDCITRMSSAQLRSFLCEIGARRVIESRNARIVELCKGLSEHSLAVALLAREVAVTSDRKLGEQAYLAGLLHDVGKPLLATVLVAAEQRLVGPRTAVWMKPEAWLSFVLAKHRAVGVALARKWGMPNAVGRSIEESVEFDTSEPRSLSNAVRLANALTKLAGLYVGRFDWEEVAAMSFVGQQLFVLDDQKVERMMTSVREQLARRAV
jgi:putative nucleotidyltransferase with HDIG domain